MAAVPALSLLGMSETFWRPTLYVGDLHPETTEADIEAAFSVIGPLDSFRICRDAVSGKSLRYAFVNFFCISHASKALACLNHTTLRGKPMRIMWWQRDPVLIKSGIGNVFVKNLAPSVTSAQLESMFSKYGTILSCKVAEENGKSKCFGFVQFETQNSAISAISSLHGAVFEGKKLYVSTFKKKQERMMGAFTEQKFNNLYVKNFDCNLTEDLLREKFSRYGKVNSAVIMRDEEGNSRGFGFVKFDSDEDAMKAVEALNGELIGSKRLFVGRAQKKSERERLLRSVCEEDKLTLRDHKLEASRLYVGNLGVSINERKLDELFRAYGKVVSVNIIRSNGISKGFGFVNFSSPGDAKAAMNSLNGMVYYGKPLYVSLAYPREEHSSKSLSSFTSSHKSLYNAPSYSLPMSIAHFNPYQSSMHQDFSRQFSEFYLAGMHNFQGNKFTYTMKSAPSVSIPDWKCGAQKQQPRTCWEPKNKNMKGATSVTATSKELSAIHNEKRRSLMV
ncbi:PREDICTED: polyadenylate-binding protein 4-like [Ipomoea nil]|uniref:polyadenylate-binding protein 4-like n=1 Tax=Ipomoea nil TaxID=35883 RepID=UPI000901E07C|nr:PREDICTED: polyadenylate-binding protein 4-like [Ipomoea nil]